MKIIIWIILKKMINKSDIMYALLKAHIYKKKYNKTKFWIEDV